MQRSRRHPLRARWPELALLALALTCVVPAPESYATDLLERVEQVYAARGIERLRFDPRAAKLEPAAARHLEQLFELTDEGVLLNANVLRGLVSRGSAGLHFEDYRTRVDELRRRLLDLPAPAGAGAPQRLVAEALAAQRDFFRDWHRALREGRRFESQLTHEYAWHDGPQRARQKLLEAYAELRGLYPDAGEAAHESFNAHLHALDLGP